MKYAAIIDYTTDAGKIAETRPLHREYLKKLLDTGHIAISGPFTDDKGGLLVYEAETLEEAEGYVSNDPFAKARVFVKWTIRPWKVIMSNPSLF